MDGKERSLNLVGDGPVGEARSLFGGDANDGDHFGKEGEEGHQPGCDAVAPFEGEGNQDEWEYFDNGRGGSADGVGPLREVAEWSAGIDQADEPVDAGRDDCDGCEYPGPAHETRVVIELK